MYSEGAPSSLVGAEPGSDDEYGQPEEGPAGLRDYEKELFDWYSQTGENLKDELKKIEDYEKELRELYAQTSDEAFLQEATSCRKTISSRWEQWDINTQHHIQKFREWEELKDCGMVLSDWFEQTDDETFLREAVGCLRSALDMTYKGIGSTAHSLGQLGLVLKVGFEHAGDRASLDESITALEGSLELLPCDHSGRSFLLLNLASALGSRFTISKDSVDLDTAINHSQSGLQLENAAHRYTFLTNLANFLSTRFRQFGDRSDLDAAIVNYQEVLLVRPPGHPKRWSSLHNLGSALHTRFEQLGERADLEAAIMHCQAAVQLLPQTNESDRFTCLSNLGNILLTRFELAKIREDLDAAILNFQGAVQLVPPGHVRRYSCLNLLGNALLTRFREDQNRADLDAAIFNYQHALQDQLPGDDDRCVCSSNFAAALHTRFQEENNSADLEEAVIHHERNLELTPINHPNRSAFLINLASTLIPLEESNTETTPESLNFLPHVCQSRSRVMDLLREAAASETGGSLSDHLIASLRWASMAAKWSDPSAVAAHRTALGLLDAIVATGGTIESRRLRLESKNTANSMNVAANGAACAIASGQIRLAVEMLEQGRGILLTQMGHYRTQLDDLEVVQPSLAEAFRRISAQMEASVMMLNEPRNMVSAHPSISDPIAAYQELSNEWTGIVQKIRALDAFSTFMLPTPFHILQASASNGPVILFNISKLRTDAIIVSLNADPMVVPLPQASWDFVTTLTVKHYFLVGEDRCSKHQEQEFKNLLRGLWEAIMRPVVALLQNQLHLQRGSRIWLCPTSLMTLLPLHAAGDYEVLEQNVPDLFVCSYTPTLSALSRAYKKQSLHSLFRPTNILVIGQSKTPGQVELPAVSSEIRAVKASTPQVTVLEGEAATRAALVRTMNHHPWVHLACHGHVDEHEPFQSSFALHDGPLTLLDVVRQNLPHAELAFLSACHSAKVGVWSREDEVLHLAAGMQFAGFKSVVGTLWAVCDADGPIVAEVFYSSLFGTKGRPRAKSTAHALHRAAAELRSRPGISFSRWACFIHIGL